MTRFRSVFDRLLQAFLMASSVALLGAGLLSYSPSAFGEGRTPEPVVGGDPRLTPSPRGNNPASGALNATPTPVDLDPKPSGTPATADQAEASRIRIPSLQIDLPVVPGDLVVPGNADLYPLCDVAMFLPQYAPPGVPGATYIYAHAQRGMFLPLLKASQVDDGSSLVGALIEVYTADALLHLYEVYQVKRHATDLSLAEPPPGVHMLVLQTSEGVSGTIPKLQVAARPVSVVPASGAEANPVPHPRVCLAQ